MVRIVAVAGAIVVVVAADDADAFAAVFSLDSCYLIMERKRKN